MRDSPQPADGNKQPGSEPAEQACEGTVENLKENIVGCREILTELAAYDEEIGI